jgi:hypothetical protein
MSIHLLPEVEAGLRAEADARGVSVDSLIAEVLARYVRQGAVKTSINRVAFNARKSELAWAANPDGRYSGKWVVLEGSAVIASGAEPKSIYEEALSQGIASPFLIYVPSEPNESFAGGWLD